MASLFRLWFPSARSAPPHPPPQRRADKVELADRLSPHHVIVYIPDMDRPVDKSDGRTVVKEIDPAKPQLSLEDALACCTKTMLKIMFIVVVVYASFMFIQYAATTKMTWIRALLMLLLGALLAFFFLMASLVCWPDAICFTAHGEKSTE
uniref:Uncharacterized protein n=1 Tax=Arundo donax TaxID=35708 RepID=A0A0A9A7E8_ARUDO